VNPLDPTPTVVGSAVALAGVVALVGGFPVLSGVDLRADAGEVVWLRGPNGAGKTSTLRLCAGLIGVTRGTAVVAGCDLVRDRKLVRRRIGLLGHGAAMYEDLTVEENVRFTVAASGADPTSVPAALDVCGLSGRLLGQRMSTLSAGQRRRTALAALVARRPSVWLLDEPHAGLDPEGRDLIDALCAQSAAQGACVVIASHDVDRAATIAHRTVTITGGSAEAVLT
jgi:heme ABC exporter ATP-binding subunit CcmA